MRPGCSAWGPATLALLWEYGLTAGWFELVDSADRRRTWAVTDKTAWRWGRWR